MSGRGHVDVNERRLRPIYDALDNGNNKKAIQESDKVLRKQKDLYCAKVLKALALLRLGRHDECEANLEEVHNVHPSDEGTLQAMAICYRESHRLDKIAEMYENATKVKKDSEELLSSLFMSYVRLCDYKKQHQTAMTLHRLRPQKNPYYFWAIMSLVMQAHEDEALSTKMFLPLAERMTKKYIDDNKIEAEAEVQMYIIILEQLGKYEEALNILKGPFGAKVTSEPNYQSWKIADCMSKLKRWPYMNAAYRKLLQESPDQWNFYLEYFTSLFALIDEKWTPENNSEDLPVDHVDYTVEMAKEFLESQKLTTPEGHSLRGPHLAKLEFAKYLLERGDQQVLGSPYDLLKSYFEKFGSKGACFSDMQIYLKLLDETDVKKFITELTNGLNIRKQDGSIIYVSDIKTLNRHLCLIQFSRSLGYHQDMTEEERLILSKELMQRHDDGLKFGKDLLSTELQPADYYAHLAALLLYDSWETKGDNKILWKVVVILETALQKSPSCFPVKILLIRAYSVLGAFGPAWRLFESMEIKHIQYDSLGYIISNHMGRLGHYTNTCALYEAMLKFFTIDFKDTTEYLVTSYKFGSFTKIDEFIKFRNRLQNSLQYASATVERMLLNLTLETSRHQVTESLIHHMEIDPAKDRTTWEDLSDNRDFSPMPCWEQVNKRLTEEHKQQSLKEEIAWLKLRNLTLRLLAAAVEVGQGGVRRQNDEAIGNGEAGVIQTSADILHDLTNEYKLQTTQCRTSFSKPNDYPISGPFRTRMSSFLTSNLDEVFVHTLRILYYVYTLTENYLEKGDPEMDERMESLESQMTELVTKHTCTLLTGDKQKKVLEPDVVENVVLLAETLSYMAVLLGAAHKLLLPCKMTFAKKGKKKRAASSQPAIFESFNKLVNCVEDSASKLHSAVKEIDMAFLSSEFGQLKLFDDGNQAFEQDEKIEQMITENVRLSYQKSAKELLDFLNYKIAYLSTLKV